MILEQHLDLSAVFLVHIAVKEEDDFDAESGSYRYEGGDEDLVRVAVFGRVGDDGANGLNADDKIYSSHTVRDKEEQLGSFFLEEDRTNTAP